MTATADLTPSSRWAGRLERPHPRTTLTRGVLARALVARVLRDLPVRLVHPDGSSVGAGGATDPVLEVRRPESLYRRLESHPKIGLGEAYMAGDWAAAHGTDLADALVPFAARLDRLLPPWLLSLRGLVERAIPHSQRNTPQGSRANIEAHYDLSNDLFAAFLDGSMTYSSALFDPARPLAEQPLEEAQERKVDALLDAAGVGEGTRLLEIGSGWGALALRAARRGALVTTTTLSKEQASHVRHLVAQAGYAGRVEVRVEDYRETTGQFDAVVSCEMVEAVGEEFWPDYFATLDARLAPGGRAAVQAILMRHDRFLATRRSYGWIQKYIFPGGLIPSVTAIEEVTARHTSLRLSEAHHFGGDYAVTLRRWREAFLARWPHIHSLGFDETFRRMWEFYLAYCEAGFATGYLDVAQLTFERPQEVR